VVVIRHIARMLVGVTMLVAALGSIPVAAVAHAGHAHAAQPHRPIAHSHWRTVEAHVRAQAAQGHVHVSRHAVHTQVHVPLQAPAYADDAGPMTPALAAATPGDAPDSPQYCPGGCCCCMSAGCGFAWLTPAPSLAAPAAVRFEPEPLSDTGSGITPDALPEPPRTLT
jgi:hypothetical protein